MLRVIAGSVRGRQLRAAKSTRPTADLIRGAIFSMLEALAYKRGFEPDEDGALAAALAWPHVLDLFAGSGALGIEALSRGAHRATFIEQDRVAARVIVANLQLTGLAEHAAVHTGSVNAMLSRVREPVDLAFADPPYAEAAARAAALDGLAESGLLHPRSVVVLEQPADDSAPETVGLLPLVSTRRHGRTRISLYALTE